MKQYLVYFEIYKKKMKVRVWANSAQEAENIVRNDLKIHKIDLADTEKTLFDFFDGIFK